MIGVLEGVSITLSIFMPSPITGGIVTMGTFLLTVFMENQMQGDDEGDLLDILNTLQNNNIGLIQNAIVERM